MCVGGGGSGGAFGVQTGLQVLSSTAQFVHSDRAVRSLNRDRRRIQALEVGLARSSAELQFDAVRSRALERRRDISRELERVTREALQSKALARVSAGEAGVSGQTVVDAVRDFERAELNFRSSALDALESREAQDARDLKATLLQLQGRELGAAIRGVPRQRPSLLGAALGLGTDVFESFVDNTVPTNQGGFLGREFP